MDPSTVSALWRTSKARAAGHASSLGDVSDFSRPRKVALVVERYAPHPGGIELHVQELARHLRAAGHEVHVLTTFPGPDLVDSIPVHRLRVPLFPIWKVAFTPRGILPLDQLLRRERYDVLHGHHSVFSPAVACAAYLAQRMGTTTVMTFHSLLRGYATAFRLLDRWVNWSDWPVALTAVSKSVAADVRSVVRDRPVDVLANGVDAEYWSVAPAPRTPGEVRIVTVMRITPRKRPRALVEMLARVRERLRDGPRLRVHWIGDGPDRPAVERLIRRLGLHDVVELAGSLTRAAIRDAYARADLFVLPSIEESFGLAALEARCVGLPVVAMAAGGAAAFIRDGQEGLLAGSDAEMVACLVRLISDQEVRASIAQHNRSTPPPYRWSDVVTEHLRVYGRAAAAVSQSLGF